MSGEITNGQNRQSRRSRPAAKPAKPKDSREKITLLISKEADVKLSTLAALRGRVIERIVVGAKAFQP